MTSLVLGTDMSQFFGDPRADHGHFDRRCTGTVPTSYERPFTASEVRSDDEFDITFDALQFVPKKWSVVSEIELIAGQAGDDIFAPHLARAFRNHLVARVKASIDAHAAKRLDAFIDYQAGWDAGEGRELDSGSLAAFQRILDAVSLVNKDVSLFMSREGYVVLNWHNPQGSLVELEIQPDAAILFSASDDSETTLPLDTDRLRAEIASRG